MESDPARAGWAGPGRDEPQEKRARRRRGGKTQTDAADGLETGLLIALGILDTLLLFFLPPTASRARILIGPVCGWDGRTATKVYRGIDLHLFFFHFILIPSPILPGVAEEHLGRDGAWEPSQCRLNW